MELTRGVCFVRDNVFILFCILRRPRSFAAPPHGFVYERRIPIASSSNEVKDLDGGMHKKNIPWGDLLKDDTGESTIPLPQTFTLRQAYFQ